MMPVELLLAYIKTLTPGSTPYSDPQASYDTGFYRAAYLIEKWVKEHTSAK